LGKLAVAAQARVARLRAELEADPAAGDRRQRAAQLRAAREQEERVKAALDRMSELEAERARREKTNKAEVSRQKEPRASTTDAEARSMKLADGGFRPAYNMQITSAPKGQVIVAVDIDTTGSDRGLVRPALEQLSAAGTRRGEIAKQSGRSTHFGRIRSCTPDLTGGWPRLGGCSSIGTVFRSHPDSLPHYGKRHARAPGDQFGSPEPGIAVGPDREAKDGHGNKRSVGNSGDSDFRVQTLRSYVGAVT